MKNGRQYILGLALAVTLAAGLGSLTACGKSNGGSNNNPAVTAAACTYAANGTCIPGVGVAGYAGDGNWQGTLNVSNYSVLPPQLGIGGPTGLPYGGGYANYQQQLYISISLPGCLPATATVSIGSYLGSYMMGTAYLNSANTGFLINNLSNSGSYYGQFGQPTSSALSVSATWYDTMYRSQINVQLLYNGQIVAQGVLYGSSNYVAGGVNYCSTYGSGGYYGQPGYNGGAGAWAAPYQTNFTTIGGSYYYPIVGYRSRIR